MDPAERPVVSMSAFVVRVQQVLHPAARVPAGMGPGYCEAHACPFAAMGGREHQWHACHQVETRETSEARTAFTNAIYPRESSHSRGSPETIPPHLSCLPMLTSPLRRKGCCFHCICDRTPPRGGIPGQVKCDGRWQPPFRGLFMPDAARRAGTAKIRTVLAAAMATGPQRGAGMHLGHPCSHFGC